MRWFARFWPSRKPEDPLDPAATRVRSDERLRRVGVRYPAHLPLLDRPSTLRPLEEAVVRTAVLNAMAGIAHGAPLEVAKGWLEEHRLLTGLTPRERAFVEQGVGRSNSWFWSVESLWALMWAMGKVEELHWNRGCTPNFVEMMPRPNNPGSWERWREGLALRPLSDIFQLADEAYGVHWAARDARLKGWDCPVKLREPEIEARRMALDWLIGDTAWDDLDLST